MNQTQTDFWSKIETLLNNTSCNQNEILEEVYQFIAKYYNNRITIEISQYDNTSEIIFCWWHNKDNIKLIENLIHQAPKIKWYLFTWPKQAQWFNFELNINNQIIHCENLLFYPLKSNSSENKLWLSIYSQNELDIEILWKILETWIWEKLASEIDYLSLSNSYDEDCLNINLLWDYISWYWKK